MVEFFGGGSSLPVGRPGRRRRFGLIAAILMVLQLALPSMIPAAQAGEVDLPGEGTPEHPYLITSADDLRQIENDMSANYRLENDIPMSGLWTPIGKGLPDTFTGTLDGQGYTISGLTIDENSGQVGLFAVIGSGGTVRNLVLSGVNIQSGSGAIHSGTLAGILKGNVYNVVVESGTVNAANTFAGGLVGRAEEGAVIQAGCTNVHVIGSNITIPTALGGLVGILEDSTVTESCATGSVSGGNTAGGLVGTSERSTITDSYSTAPVSAAMVFSPTGGIIGSAGDQTEIRRVYAAGPVSGFFGAALVGQINWEADVTIADSYYNADTTGQTDPLGTPLSQDEALDESSFEGWNFETLWHIDERTGQPTFLRDDDDPPVMFEANIEDETPGVVTVKFAEKILADAEALIRFVVTADGTEVEVSDSQLSPDGRQLILTLAEPVQGGQIVKVSYTAMAPHITDKAGHQMATHEIKARNGVVLPLEIESVSPAENATGVVAVAQVGITFNQPVEAVGGKSIYLYNEKGDIAEQIEATSANVQIADKTVTIRLDTELAHFSNYRIRVQYGAFKTESGAEFDGIQWSFMTAADPEAKWKDAGNPKFGNGLYPNLKAGEDGTLYVAFRDNGNDGKATVMKLGPGDTTWSPVGEAGFSPWPIGAPSLLVDGNTLYVAYAYFDEDYYVYIQVRQYALNGSGEWELAGEGIPIGEMNPELLVTQDPQPFLHMYEGDLYVAYQDGLPYGGMTVRKLAEGGVWEPVGDREFSPGDIYHPTLVTHEGMLIAGFHDYEFDVKNSATAMRYEDMSGDWVGVGIRGITFDGEDYTNVFEPTLVSDGTWLYFVYSNDEYKAAAMRYNWEQNSWVAAGGVFSASQAYETTAWAGDGEVYAAYRDTGHGNKLTVKKFSGSTWVPVGSNGFTPGKAYNPSLIVVEGVTYVAFEDSDRNLNVMKYGVFNDPPAAKNVGIEGELKIGETAEGTYTFTDAEGDEEGESLYQWYTADNEEGDNKTAITGATELKLDLTLDLLDKYLIFEVTPVAATGTKTGAKVSSAPQGPVTTPDAPEAPNVTADDTRNVIVGADETMEYSTDGGLTYTPYDPAHPPVFAGNVTVLVRVKANETTGAPAGAAKTLTFTANSAPAPAPSPSPSPMPAPAPTPTATEEPAGTGGTGVTVLINGKEESAGTASTSTRNGQSVTTVTVDPDKVEARLAEEGLNAVVTIPVPSGSDVVVGELNGRIVKSMADRQALLEIRTDRATYTIPAEQFDIGAISEELGALDALADIKVRVEIGQPPAETVQMIENAAADGTYAIVVPPVEFTVRAEYEGRSVEMAKFTAYVERAIAIPDGVDPDRITTGVVFDEDGTPRHVPTKIVVIDGKYYAVISSLTNSAYGVVWNPVEFDDMASHWAKDTVNNTGSRMIIAGTGEGRFSPDRHITRAEFAAMIVRALGLGASSGPSAFTDVKESDWFSGAIRTAVEYGLLSGYADGAFRPNDKITREQAMVILARAMTVTGLKDRLTGGLAEDVLGAFTDADQASAWAIQGIADSVTAGIVQGRDERTLAPQAFITRAEAAAMVERLLIKSDLI